MVGVVDENRPAIAEVLWEDPWIEADDVLEKEAIDFVPALRSTVGYVISKNDDDCLVLSTDLYQEDRGKEDPMIIPWRSILVVWEFEVH